MKKVVVEMDLHDRKQKRKAMGAVSCLAGICSVDVRADKQLIVVGDVDPLTVVKNLRKYCGAVELLTFGPVMNEEHRKEMERRRNEEHRKEMERRRNEEQKREMERRRNKEHRREVERRRNEEQKREMERRRNEEHRRQMERRRNEEHSREVEKRRNEEHRRELERRRRSEEQKREKERRRNEEERREIERRRNEGHRKEEKSLRMDAIVPGSTKVSDLTKRIQAVVLHAVSESQRNKCELEVEIVKLKFSGTPPPRNL